MTSSFPGSAAVTASMNVPQTQNTAPVLEFRCLYTQDLRRKQKRWQDGRLKFHTFNKRVMVYDERSNFVGDTHFREDSEFAEGEELELERSGILVEVGECIGKRDQDLTELVDKRVKDREERAAAKIALPATSTFRTQGTPTSNHLQPKSLNTLVAPTGHYGRALVPGTSPFEERQKLTDAQEKDEQERPAKRRRQNEPAPSKSGYAQNLMGTALSLKSSRPQSTPTIRYEPLKMKVSVPVRSTIDLTLAGSDDSDQDPRGRTSGVKDTTRPKVQKKSKRSPTAKSGYASNLTGAALSLSRPESFGRNRIGRIETPRPVITSNRCAHEESSEEEEEGDSFNRIVSKKPTLKVAPKPKERPKAQMSRIPSSLSSSPPPPRRGAREKVTPAVRKEATRPRTSVQDSSGIEPKPNRPISALRIKARSGPRMMMLMDRPSSRQCASVDSSGLRRSNSMPIQKLPKPSNEIVLSQATIQLNAFCQRQEEKLQARLRGERHTRIMDLDDLSSPVDSGIDSGIDHQMIDQLLSRRSGQAKMDLEASVDLGNGQNSANEKEASEEVQGVAPPEQSKEQSSPDLEPSSPPAISKKPPPEVPHQSERSLIESSTGIIADEDRVERVNNPPISALARIPDHQDQVLDSSPANEAENVTTLAQTVRTEVIAPEPEGSISRGRKPKSLARHCIGDIQADREHFRSLVKSSASQQHELAGVPQIVPDIEARPEVTRPPPENHENPREMPPKTFSELPQPPENSAPVDAGENVPAIDGTLHADRAPMRPAAAVIPSMPPPRRLLVNPATRGKSVQALAANTIDTLSPTSNVMAPQPPRLSTRTEKISGRNDAAKARGAASKEALDGGPWSREAFDLFGPSVHETVGKLRTVKAAAGCT